jgi:very-short-patch-repair endonuclease
MSLQKKSQHSPRPLVGEGKGRGPKFSELPLPHSSPTGKKQGRGKILTNAKILRSHQTEVEERLWYHLRAHRFMGLKFKRQKPMGSYIVDFVCVERRLIIELDGGQHAEQTAYDQRRDAWLSNQGYTVLRFWNNEVMQELEGVLEKIRLALTLSPSPSPVNGRGE